MRSRITAVVTLNVAAVITLVGCSTAGTPGTRSSASPAPAPAVVLAAAVTKTAGASFKEVLAGDTRDEDMTGSYDATHKMMSIGQSSGADPMRIVVSDDDMYLSGLSDLDGKIWHLHTSKLSDKASFAFFADPRAPLTLLGTADKVELTGPRQFRGVLDLAGARGDSVGARKFLDRVTTAAGGHPGAIAFTAAIDEQGHLVRFGAILPGMDDGKDGSYAVTFSDFGAQITVTAPTGPKVVEAPASIYSS